MIEQLKIAAAILISILIPVVVIVIPAVPHTTEDEHLSERAAKTILEISHLNKTQLKEYFWRNAPPARAEYKRRMKRVNAKIGAAEIVDGDAVKLFDDLVLIEKGDVLAGINADYSFQLTRVNKNAVWQNPEIGCPRSGLRNLRNEAEPHCLFPLPSYLSPPIYFRVGTHGSSSSDWRYSSVSLETSRG